LRLGVRFLPSASRKAAKLAKKIQKACPPGQRPVLVSVRYTNVYVSRPQAGMYSIPGTFVRVFYKLR